MRKTFEVKKFKEQINKQLENKNLSQDQKKTLCYVLERVLMDTGNYKGYNSLKWINGGFEQWMKDGKPEDNSPYLGNEYDRRYF